MAKKKQRAEARLRALVGTNIGEDRFEEGEPIDVTLTEQQVRFLVAEGFAEEIKQPEPKED